MGEQRTVQEVFDLHHELMLELDMSGQADLFAEDGEIHFPFAPAGAPSTVKGRDNIRKLLVETGERVRAAGHRPTGYRNETRHQTSDPGILITQFEVHVEDGAGSSFDIPYLQVLTVRNGEIAVLGDYFTPATAAMKLAGKA
jgi:ketosteroid isomerase-like protein